ncbi:DUF3592 domain-containing protein [Alkalimonas sp. NCh-2]|uniref:DUF3592 domain-containing protein n=1 Tax=Alkalimonas sp. NCh-2 TaxID=3144846 RepID=UPI0031F66E5F
MRTFIYLLLAIFFWSLAAMVVHKRFVFIEQSEAVEAVITDVRLSNTQRSRNRSRSTETIVQFRTPTNQLIEHAPYRHRSSSQKDKGKTLTVLYAPDHPEQVVIKEFMTLWFLALFCGLIAMGFTLLCLRQLLPASPLTAQWLKNLRTAALVPAGLCFALAIKILLLR